MNWRHASLTLTTTAILLQLPVARAAEERFGPDPNDVQAVLDKAANFLKNRQGPDGSFSPKIAGPGVSSIIAAGLLRNGYSRDDPLVAKTLGFLEKSVKKDG